jgi:hypothetical protein
MVAPKMLPVKSSNILSVGHDPETQELHVEFSTGGTYKYSGISAAQHAALLSSDSIGKHMKKHIGPAAKSHVKVPT